jgi:hypothetical protein
MSKLKVVLKDYSKILLDCRCAFEEFQRAHDIILNWIISQTPNEVKIDVQKKDLIFPLQNEDTLTLEGCFCPEYCVVYLENEEKRIIIEIRMNAYILVKAQIIDPFNSLEFQGIESVHQLPNKFRPYVEIFFNSNVSRSGVVLTQKEFEEILPKVFEFLLE